MTTMEFVHNPEGYIRYYGPEEHYHFYHIKDLLGNVRETHGQQRLKKTQNRNNMKKHIYMLIYISICLQSCIRYYIVNDPYKYDHYRPSENELYGLWQSIEDSASIRLNKDGTCEVKNIPTTRRSEEFSTTKYSTLPYIVYGEANKLSSITEWNFYGYWKIESYPARENKEWFRIVMSPHPVFASDIQYYKLSKNDDYKNLKNGFYISINIRNKFENDSVHVAYLYETIGDPDMQDEYVLVPTNY